MLTGASIVVPIAALVVGHGPSVAAVPFGAAAVAYVLCVRECGSALLPRSIQVGLLGGEMLEASRRLDVDLGHMQETAARYLDDEHRRNRDAVCRAADNLRRAIMMLTGEVLALAVALLLTLIH